MGQNWSVLSGISRSLQVSPRFAAFCHCSHGKLACMITVSLPHRDYRGIFLTGKMSGMRSTAIKACHVCPSRSPAISHVTSRPSRFVHDDRLVRGLKRAPKLPSVLV